MLEIYEINLTILKEFQTFFEKSKFKIFYNLFL